MIINMSKPENSEIDKESVESSSNYYITSDEGVSEDKSLKQSTNLEIESLECQGYSDKQEPWVRVCLCEKSISFKTHGLEMHLHPMQHFLLTSTCFCSRNGSAHPYRDY